MRKPLLLVTCLSFSCILAQPTFQATDLTPAFGTVLTSRSAEYRAAGTATNGFVYDASDLVLGAATSVVLVDPATTPYGANFPSATVATVSTTSPELYSYIQMSPGAFSNLGWQNSTASLIASDPIRTYIFPLELGTFWLDNFHMTVQAVVQQDTIISEHQGVCATAYSAYGTLILPFGEFTNVARIEAATTYSNSSTYEVSYIAAGYPFALFNTGYNLADVGQGMDTVSRFTWMIDPSMLGIAEASPTIKGTLGPNPVNGLTYLTLSTAAVSGIEVRVLDATGRVVGIIQPTLGDQRFVINTAGMASGLYFVRAIENSGATGSWPLVVE